VSARLLRARGRGLALFLLLALGAGLAWFLLAFGRIAAGYAATITALQVFGGGDTLATVRAERLRLPLGLGRLLTCEVEERAGLRLARARFLGLIERRAAGRAGLGATRVPEDGALAPVALSDLVPPLPEDQPWPLGESDELAPLASAPRAALEAALDAAFVEPASGRSRGTHAVVVVRDGSLLAERYHAGHDRRTPLLGWSMTKSVTATLCARGIALGRLASVDVPAHVPEWSAADDPRRAITHAQLLRMTSGLAFFANYELPWSDSLRMLFASPDVARYAAEQELAHAPGTVWSYSDGTSNLLARSVSLLAAEDEEERRLFPQRALFAPLRMATAVLSVDAAGNWVGSSLMQASARDWARFGWLYADDGRFAGQRLLPEGWVDFVARATPESPHHGYGAHFWRYDAAHGRTAEGRSFDPLLGGVFYVSGHDGQYLWIDRARRAVVVRLGVRGPAAFDPEGFLAAVLGALEPPTAR
jgi:CubicO group peptidase (beta-lactamase class C family)